MSTRVRHEGGSCGFGFSPLYDPALMSQSNRVSIVVFFFSFLFFFVSLPIASQGRSLVFSAILIETHSSSAVRSKKNISIT